MANGNGMGAVLFSGAVGIRRLRRAKKGYEGYEELQNAIKG
jgi:hypothetical protein